MPEEEVGGLGFRRVHEFNLALLAKQGWRLLTDPSSLMCQILKAKYFPTSTFLEAEPGSIAGFTWRSIWESKSLLRLSTCRIGDGTSITVWSHPWLPNVNDPYISFSSPIEREDTRVCDLFIPRTRI